MMRDLRSLHRWWLARAIRVLQDPQRSDREARRLARMALTVASALRRARRRRWRLKQGNPS